MISQATPKIAHMLGIFAIVFALAGCVFTGSDYTPSGSGHVKTSLRAERSPDGISVVEGDMGNMKYVVLGKVEAYARAVNLWSSDPTRADIDEELRAKAANIGADAVIKVKYHTERQGLASRGKMTAEGLAISFVK